MTISKILNRHNWHPLCVHELQLLHFPNFVRQVEFCNWLLINQDIDPHFVMNILWTDECFWKMEQLTHTTIFTGLIIILILSMKYTTRENSLLLYGVEFGMENQSVQYFMIELLQV